MTDPNNHLHLEICNPQLDRTTHYDKKAVQSVAAEVNLLLSSPTSRPGGDITLAARSVEFQDLL